MLWQATCSVWRRLPGPGGAGGSGGAQRGPRDPPPTDISRRRLGRRGFVVASVTGRLPVAAVLFFIGPPRASPLFPAQPCGACQPLTSTDLTRRAVPAERRPGRRPRPRPRPGRSPIVTEWRPGRPAAARPAAPHLYQSRLGRQSHSVGGGRRRCAAHCSAITAARLMRSRKTLITERDWLSPTSSSIIDRVVPVTRPARPVLTSVGQ